MHRAHRQQSNSNESTRSQRIMASGEQVQLEARGRARSRDLAGCRGGVLVARCHRHNRKSRGDRSASGMRAWRRVTQCDALGHERGRRPRRNASAEVAQQHRIVVLAAFPSARDRGCSVLARARLVGGTAIAFAHSVSRWCGSGSWAARKGAVMTGDAVEQRRNDIEHRVIAKGRRKRKRR